MEKIMTNYDLNRLNTIKPTLTLLIFEALIDGGYKDDEAKQPEQVPYYCELTATWNGDTYMQGNFVAISTHGLIYAQADGTKFKRWDTARFEIDYITNSDSYDIENKQDNSQGFEFNCLLAYDNYADVSQATADILEHIATNLGDYTVNIEYPNGAVELIGLKPY